jgi:hypothetical protein
MSRMKYKRNVAKKEENEEKKKKKRENIMKRMSEMKMAKMKK